MWRNGRRARFRSVCPKGRGGSTPPIPTRTPQGLADHRRALKSFPNCDVRPREGGQATERERFRVMLLVGFCPENPGVSYVAVALVTGSGGLIGSEAVRHFAGLGLDVVGIDNDMRQE